MKLNITHRGISTSGAFINIKDSNTVGHLMLVIKDLNTVGHLIIITSY